MAEDANMELTCIKVTHLKEHHWDVLSLDIHDNGQRQMKVNNLKVLLQYQLQLPKSHQLLSIGPDQLLEEDAPLLPESSGSAMVHLTDYRRLVPNDAPNWIAGTEERGISAEQLRNLLDFIERRRDAAGLLPGWCCKFADAPNYGEVLAYESFNLYEAVDWIIKPATQRRQCSWVELVGNGRLWQSPQWFVSHAWIEPVVLFIKCIEEHRRLRHLSETTAYWICAYANNQHALDEEIQVNPQETSFFRAMCECEGVVLVLDDAFTPFSRIWCCFEASVVALAKEQGHASLLLDVANVGNDGIAHVMTDGITEEDLSNRRGQPGREWAMKAEREQAFPVERLLEEALHLDIAKAAASHTLDRNRILNSLAGKDKAQLNDEPTLESTDCARVNVVNAKIRSIYAVTCWRQCVSKERRRSLHGLMDALQADTGRQELDMHFEHLRDLDDRRLQMLGAALPTSLERLTLKMDDCKQVGDAGVAALCRQLPDSSLTSLDISLIGCDGVSNRGVAAIAVSLPSTLRNLRVSFWECSKIGNEGLAALSKSLVDKRSLEELKLSFQWNESLRDDCLSFFARLLPGALRVLDLNLEHCSRITDKSLAALGTQLVEMSALHTLVLNLSYIEQLTTRGAASLAWGFTRFLQRAEVNLQGSGVEPGVQRLFADGITAIRTWVQGRETEAASKSDDFSEFFAFASEAKACPPARPTSAVPSATSSDEDEDDVGERSEATTDQNELDFSRQSSRSTASSASLGGRGQPAALPWRGRIFGLARRSSNDSVLVEVHPPSGTRKSSPAGPIRSRASLPLPATPRRHSTGKKDVTPSRRPPSSPETPSTASAPLSKGAARSTVASPSTPRSPAMTPATPRSACSSSKSPRSTVGAGSALLSAPPALPPLNEGRLPVASRSGGRSASFAQ
eukprot:TRINITY_DN27861_c0_g4_i1.p1 TRINITY_DN27861_c0_g4~~TRINITY_DN27861_c0_g4_i1.p1  ORF type:complete len:911 (+),score=154.47 TRINITY_DN27861_c0_g4_i1:86-2818(+)